MVSQANRDPGSDLARIPEDRSLGLGFSDQPLTQSDDMVTVSVALQPNE
jgi:hypothetical protein